MVESLYRFFPYNAHDLDALSNNYLWFSSYEDFNDPFEDVFVQNAINSDLGEYQEEKAVHLYKELHKNDASGKIINEVLIKLIMEGKLRDYYERHLKEVVFITQRELRDHIKTSKACCLVMDHSSDNKKALKNKLMWSHYGNGLRGFCVEYDYDLLIKSLSELSGQDINLCPMEYRQLKKNTLVDLFIGIIDNNKKYNIGSLAATKSFEWSYENEFRLIIKNKGNINYFSSKSIKSITFGEKMPQEKLITLLSVLKGNENIDCNIYRAYIDLESFEIERELYSKTV